MRAVTGGISPWVAVHLPRAFAAPDGASRSIPAPAVAFWSEGWGGLRLAHRAHQATRLTHVEVTALHTAPRALPGFPEIGQRIPLHLALGR
jgi:hypothetical protein